MRGWLGNALVSLGVGLAAVPVAGYSGIGRAAVEKALGRVPGSEEDLEREIERLEALRLAEPGSAGTAYQLAILKLNEPHGYDLPEMRRLLAAALAIEPGHADALEVWLDLIPRKDDLEELGRALGSRAESDAASAWALANVAQRQGRWGEAMAALDAAEGLDPSYRGRCRWLKAVVLAERDDDEGASQAWQESLDAIDPPTAERMWKNAVLVATPEEIERYRSKLSEGPKDYFVTFWKRRDAFPLSEVNERFGEHLRRLRRARDEYALSSNGRGYLTMHDVFKQLSPDLPFYASDVVFDYQEKVPDWLDHRGLIYVRHGEPDRVARSTEGARAETWLYYRFTFKPLLFHLIDRRGVGEFVITLNLGQALTLSVIEDDPEQVLANARDFLDLYSSRGHFHQVFQQIATSRSAVEVEDLLEREAMMMAAFPKETWYDETNNLIDRDEMIPFAAYSSNFRAEDGKVDCFVYYAIPEKELEKEGPEFEFDSTVVLYSSNWAERTRSAEHHFRYQRPEGKKPGKHDLLVGALELRGLEPGRYNFAFQVTERRSGKVGIAKGRLVADYFGPGWVNLSDLLLAGEVVPATTATIFERNGQKVVPIPTRTLTREQPGQVYFEVYDLKPGADGKNHYQIEYRLLQIQQEPSVAEKILGLGMNVAGIFFPYHIFLARAGLFGVDVVSANPDKGLDVTLEERTAPAEERISETLTIDTDKHPPGIYQVYVTVKDFVSGSLSTRSLRFAIAK